MYFLMTPRPPRSTMSDTLSPYTTLCLSHSLCWPVMSPKGGGQPTGDVAKRIDSDLGGFDQFKEAFTQAALTRFGSGWAWLRVDTSGRLSVQSRAHQDSPLMQGIGPGNHPLLGRSLGEHAYYLKY